MHRSVRAALMATLLAAAPNAQAANVTPEQAKALEAQVRGWLQDTLGPDARIADRPVQVTPDSDHYHLELPIRVSRGFKPSAITITGSARPASGGRWTIEDVQFPSPSSFTLEMPTPRKEGQKTPAPPTPVDYTVTIGSQENQGVYDPSFATPSTLDDEPPGSQGRRQECVDRTAHDCDRAWPAPTRCAHRAWTAWTSSSTARSRATPSAPSSATAKKSTCAAQKVRVTSEVTAVSRDRVAKIIPVLVRLTGGVAPGMPKPGSKAPTGTAAVDPQLLRSLVQSLQDFASELALDETVDGLAVRYGSSGGTANQLRIGHGRQVGWRPAAGAHGLRALTA